MTDLSHKIAADDVEVARYFKTWPWLIGVLRAYAGAETYQDVHNLLERIKKTDYGEANVPAPDIDAASYPSAMEQLETAVKNQQSTIDHLKKNNVALVEQAKAHYEENRRLKEQLSELQNRTDQVDNSGALRDECASLHMKCERLKERVRFLTEERRIFIAAKIVAAHVGNSQVSAAHKITGSHVEAQRGICRDGLVFADLLIEENARTIVVGDEHDD